MGAKLTHKMIADVAKEIAAEAYESVAHDNTFYAEWPSRRNFVRANWRMFVDDARRSLLAILSGEYPQSMKDEVYEALVKDGSLKNPQEWGNHVGHA